MKPLVCLFIVCNAFFIAAHSQELAKTGPTVKFGLKIGGNASNVSRSIPSVSPVVGAFSGQEKRIKTGFDGGVALRYAFSDRFFAGAEILWATQRAGVDATDSNVLIKTDYKFSWIQLPLGFNYIFNPQSRHKVYAGMGMSAQRLVKAKGTITVVFPTGQTQGAFSLLDEMNRWNASGRVNVGFILSSKTREIMTIAISAERTLFNVHGQPGPVNPVFDFSIVQTEMRVNTLSVGTSIFIH